MGIRKQLQGQSGSLLLTCIGVIVVIHSPQNVVRGLVAINGSAESCEKIP